MATPTTRQGDDPEDVTSAAEPDGTPVARGRLLAMLSNALSAVGSAWIVGLMFLIVADVLGRSFFDHPITGVAEISARSVVAIVFLQVSAAVMAGRMTRADFLVRFLRKRMPRVLTVLETAFALTGAVMFALIVWAVWPSTVDAWRTSEFFGVRGVFTIPTLPFWAIIVLGGSLAVLAYLLSAWEQARTFRGGRK